MNTRLQELEKQSYELFKDENLIECFVFSKEKFAELIVRECAAVASNHHLYGALTPEIALKNHFKLK